MSRTDEIVVTSDESGQLWSAAAWDPRTGTQLSTYKNNSTLGRNTVNILADSYLMGADATKPRLYFWPLNKQTPVENMRFVVPGSVGALSASPDGSYVVAAIGEKLCVWQISTGGLLCVLTRHYQRVTCLKFTSDGSTFVSGGEDGLVFVWSLSSAASKTANYTGSRQASPIYSFSDHTLPVKDIFVGRFGIQGRLITVSSDRTARIYDMDGGTPLLTFVFEVPLTCACADARENYLFVGSTTGDIRALDLLAPPRGREHHIDRKEEAMTFKGHAKSVACLSVSGDCRFLVSGSADGLVNIWHIDSRQIVRTIPHKGPVTAAFFTRAVDNFFAQEIQSKLVLHSLQRTARDDDGDDDVIEIVNRNYGDESYLDAASFVDFNDGHSPDADSHHELQLAREEMKILKATNAEMFKFGVEFLTK